MSFYKRHLSTYGCDRKLMFIIDKLNFYLKDEIENLGFSKVAKKHLRVKGYFIKKCYYSLPLSFKKILRKLK